MHFRVYVEDRSGGIMLKHVLPKLQRTEDTFEVKYFRGIGRLPKNLTSEPDPKLRGLLDKLPGLLRAAGKEFADYDAAVIIIADLDNREPTAFVAELEAVLDGINPKPRVVFRLAIEEGEAWLLGDRAAVKSAYPAARDVVLDSYRQDSICGTWEVLANAVHPGGAAALDKNKLPYSEIGAAKCAWAERIGPHMEPERNLSPSFQSLAAAVRSLSAATGAASA